MKLIFALMMILSLGFTGLFADGHKKDKSYKNSEKSFEKANEKAKFKRSDDWKKEKKAKKDKKTKKGKK